jgi:chromosome segregation ATPase
MSEDLTQKLPPQSFEERVLAEFAAIRQELATQRGMITQLDSRLSGVENRLTTLEEKVDERLRETRPIWEGVLQRLTAIETALDTLNRQFKTMIRDMFDLRSRIEKLEDSRPGI